MKKFNNLNLSESILFGVGLALLIICIIVWFLRFLEVYEYLLMTI